MMNRAYVLRPMVPEDGARLVELARSSPDTGQIQVAARYQLDTCLPNIVPNPGSGSAVAEVQFNDGITVGVFVASIGRMLAPAREILSGIPALLFLAGRAHTQSQRIITSCLEG